MSENETIVVGMVPAKDGLIKVVLSASKSSSLLGAKAVRACAKNNVVKDVTVPTPKSGAVVVHDDTESILKKGPAAETAPDADAVDSDKTKAMFSAHAPSPTAVFWSTLARPTDPPTAPNGVTEEAPALKLVTEDAPAFKSVTAGGAPLLSIKEFPGEPLHPIGE
eukprot:CAMPEP_0185490740 /NCGR_PEP_ID=MMETSP1366-20130426/14173_1 /TAXON_ID=38817 /ORGANISM="Gephyrocapsa oceanica, Strain RCC1303" /LENGTH=164 /DNA_ID=CAMNT_0028099443 /DNA_START=173 /DNA_END=664 /DNA_ORIENTATION=-